jgi:hypothetical protein
VASTAPVAERALWWVRSFADRDTHLGTYMPRGGSVRSRCQLEFVPLPVGMPPKVGPLPGSPPDPDQICPNCLLR